MRLASLRPRYVAARIRQMLFARAHPGAPLLAIPAIELLDDWIRPSHDMLEYGSGHSTRWFGERCGSLTSVENMPEWYQFVARETADLDNVRVELLEGNSAPGAIAGGGGAHSDRPMDGPQVAESYIAFIEQFEPRSFDLVLNDAWCRHQIGFRAVPLVRAGGLLIWDDVIHEDLQASPTPEVARFLDLVKEWRHVSFDDGVHRTTFYWAPP